MKNLIKHIWRYSAYLGLGLMLGCDHMDTEHESLLKKGELIYPGVGTDFSYRPGRLRAALIWHPSPDPGISQYVIYYNNKSDSVTVEASSHNPADEIEVVVPDLSEYVYSFTVYARDAQGNRSIPQDVNNVKVYGGFYEASLFNRPYDATLPYEIYDDGAVELNFLQPDTINLTTQILYTNTAGESAEVILLPDDAIATLPDYQVGTPVLYRSSYIPVREAIDEFWTTHYDTFPEITPYNYVLTDKSIWSEHSLAHDVGVYEQQTGVYRLWDGSNGPQGYPNIFHSNGDSPLPHHFTFDLGRSYRLSHIEVTGRNCCHNPIDFEVWGINDLNNAATALPGNDPGWKTEALSRGWKLLKEVHRSDDGSAPYKVAFGSKPPPVKYIRIRVLSVASGDANYSNLSEITFWNRE